MKYKDIFPDEESRKLNKDLTEKCFLTGEFNNDCVCFFCKHKEECEKYGEEN